MQRLSHIARSAIASCFKAFARQRIAAESGVSPVLQSLSGKPISLSSLPMATPRRERGSYASQAFQSQDRATCLPMVGVLRRRQIYRVLSLDTYEGWQDFMPYQIIGRDHTATPYANERSIIPASANGDPRPEGFHDCLALLARAHFGPKQQAKVDLSDILQQTLLDGHRKLEQLRGSTRAEMAAWLRRMLSCNIADAFRSLGARKRDAALERSLNAPLDETCSRLEVCLEAVQTSPSGRACRNEQLIRLAWAMSELPNAQREAAELPHLGGLTLAKKTAEAIDRPRPRWWGY